MDNAPPLTILLGICGIGFLAVGVPLGLYFSMRQRRGPSTGEVLQKAGQGARQPWSEEDTSLAKLSDEVARLKKPEQEKPSQDENAEAGKDH